MDNAKSDLKILERCIEDGWLHSDVKFKSQTNLVDELKQQNKYECFNPHEFCVTCKAIYGYHEHEQVVIDYVGCTKEGSELMYLVGQIVESQPEFIEDIRKIRVATYIVLNFMGKFKTNSDDEGPDSSTAAAAAAVSDS